MPKVEPVRRNPELDAYAGQWVAVKDGTVLAHSKDSREVVRSLRAQGEAGRGAVVQRVATDADALAVGMG